MDIWRIATVGVPPQRLTYHNAPSAGHPTEIGAGNLLYVAEDQDGSGPWLWSYDTGRKVSRRAAYGVEQYVSIAASADRRRLVASVANPRTSLWSVPILDGVAGEHDVKPLDLPTVRALVPRFGGASLFYLSSRDVRDYTDG
jgi:hypothetical protein